MTTYPCKNQYRKLKTFDVGFIGDSFTEPVGMNYFKSLLLALENSAFVNVPSL